MLEDAGVKTLEWRDITAPSLNGLRRGCQYVQSSHRRATATGVQPVEGHNPRLNMATSMECNPTLARFPAAHVEGAKQA